MPRNQRINEQMRAESREKILETAGRLFAGKGYFSVTIAEVAREAEMSPGNIYWYFASKEELLKAVIEGLFARLENLLAAAEGAPGGGLEPLRGLIAGMLALLRQSGEAFQVYMSILAHGGTAFFQKIGLDTVRVGMGYHAHLRVVLSRAMSDGVLETRDPDALAVYFFSFFNGLLLTYGPEGLRLPEEDITAALLRMLGAKEAL